MSLKFKPEDFGPTSYMQSASFCELANKLIDEWLAKAPVVYGDGNFKVIKRNDTDKHTRKKYTHQARLVCIEEIKKCEHPKEKVQGVNLMSHGFNGYVCKCGAKVKPVAFQEI